MRFKKTITLGAGLIFLLMLLGLTPANTLAEEKLFKEKFEKTVSLAKDGKVILTNISGDIDVKTWNRGEVKIDALTISHTDSEEQAQKNFEKVDIVIAKEEKSVRIETKYEKDYFNKSSRDVSVRYLLTIPSEASADIKSVSGDIQMEKIGNAVKAKTISGDVKTIDIAGFVDAETISGDIEVIKAQKGIECRGVSGDIEVKEVRGDSHLKTVSGEVTVQSAQGEIYAETISGDIELLGVSGALVIKVNTMSGSVDYAGDLPKDGHYYFKSHSGDIIVAIPSGAAFDLDVKTFSGKIQTDFEITVSGRLDKKSLAGSVNGGGAEIDIKTFSGDVRLEKR